MDKPTATHVAQSFLTILWAAVPPTDAELLAAVDRLLAAAHDVPEAEPEDADVDPPESDWTSVYNELAIRFPAYGLYAIASPLMKGETALLTGDVIDDLADLTTDLRKVIWHGEKIGAADAACYFHLMHDVHWGHHARELALFLHARLAETVS